MILFIIFICLFGVSAVLTFLCIEMDWGNSTLTASIILLIVSVLGTIISAGFVNLCTKPIEYPASEYDFKIKVVEFEEHRDTILVVIPKEKIKSL